MQAPHLFEYAVIRVVPHVERGEFLNVGVILYCPSEKFLDCVTDIDEERLQVLCEGMDFDELRKHIQSFERICAGKKDSGRIGQLGMAERFRWLTAARSTIVQTSEVHPGLCTNAREKLTSLYEQLVVKPKAS